MEEYLSEGNHVEYTDDGWKNAWFSATVLESPSPMADPPTAVVQCHHIIVSDTDESPLVETVQASRIRPAQEEDLDRPIEPYEVVDVFNDDVWWTGYVASRDRHGVYVFASEDPPDVLRVGRDKLRLHFRWDSQTHSWVKPPDYVLDAKNELGEFTVGTGIEYDVDAVKPGTTWRPAIYAGSRKSGEDLLLAFKYGFKGKIMWAPLSLIRPSPPDPDHAEDFKVGQKVDAFDGESWTLGEISKVFKNKRYQVAFTVASKKKNLDHDKLRPHMDWVDKQWVSSSPSNQKLKRCKSIANTDDDETPKKKAVFGDDKESRTKSVSSTKDDHESLEKSVSITNDHESLKKSVSISIGDNSGGRIGVVVEEDILARPMLGNQPHCGDICITNGESQTIVKDSGPTHSTPFMTTHSLWGCIEGMDVFQRFPQKPDFSVLPNDVESEGVAIGHMVTFANIVKKISKLNRNDTREDVQTLKNNVVKYEQYGFEVKEILDILGKWISKKLDIETLGKKVEEFEATRQARDGELEKMRERRTILMKELEEIKEKETLTIEELTKVTEKRALVEKEAASLVESAAQLVNIFGKVV